MGAAINKQVKRVNIALQTEVERYKQGFVKGNEAYNTLKKESEESILNLNNIIRSRNERITELTEENKALQKKIDLLLRRKLIHRIIKKWEK